MESHHHIQNMGGGGAVDPNTMKAFMDGPYLQWVSKNI